MDTLAFSSVRPTVDEVFKDYRARRAGVIRALTTDVNDFYASCDPEKDNLCLYGYADGSWEVGLPVAEVPPEIPEPALGINFARDGMERKDWLLLVAVHSNSWLLSVAFFLAARFNGDDRKRLFNLINDLPTVYEVLIDKEASNNKSGIVNGNKSRQSTKRSSDDQAKAYFRLCNNGDDNEDNEHSETLCRTCSCRCNYSNKFWIGCDVCERWFHGKCVTITPAKAGIMKQYKCSSCSYRKKSNDDQDKAVFRTCNTGYDDEDNEHNGILCGTCSRTYNSNEFWVGCDSCEKQFHGKCVKITPAKAGIMKQYKCTSCRSRTARNHLLLCHIWMLLAFMLLFSYITATPNIQ